MTAVKDYRDLIVWQKAMDLVETIYRTTGRFRERKSTGLQVRFAGPPSPFRRISPKGMDETQLATMCISSAWPMVPSRKSRPKCSSPSGSDTSIRADSDRLVHMTARSPA